MPRPALFATALSLCAALLAAPATTHAQPQQLQAAPGAGPASSGQARRGGRKGQIRQGTKQQPRRQRIQLQGSAESTAERDRRLRRECRGRPNAGACLGYTR